MLTENGQKGEYDFRAAHFTDMICRRRREKNWVIFLLIFSSYFECDGEITVIPRNNYPGRHIGKISIQTFLYNPGETMTEPFEEYFRMHPIKIVTAESCTAGYMASLMGGCEGCADWLEAGFITYSPKAKMQILGVQKSTIDEYGLTSEQVAAEMATGALAHSGANVAISNTGIAGPDPVDGIQPGTVCFSWAFECTGKRHVFTETKRFPGERDTVREAAARYGVTRTLFYHTSVAHGDRYNLNA